MKKKFFSLIKGDLLGAAPKVKILPAAAFSTLLEASELLENVQRMDEARVWDRLDYRSLFHYCLKRLKLSESTTSAFISVARKSTSVSELKEAVIKGTLTLSQAKRVVSVIESSNASMWLEKASMLKQRELEREVAATLSSPALKEKLKPVGGEMSELRLILPERMRIKLERLVEIRGCSMLEAFEFAMEETLKRHDPLRKAERNLGKIKQARSSRNVAAHVKHEVVTRDKARCTFLHSDGTRCENQRWLHAHHIKPRSHGGPNTVENLRLLCSQHYKAMHSE